MKIVSKILGTAVLVLGMQQFGLASSLLVSYSSTAGGGGVDIFPLVPQAAGTTFDSESTAIHSITVANNVAYWATATQVWSDSLQDATGGAAKTALPSVPFGGVTISDLAVDPATGSYYVGWNAPGFGWFIAQYPAAAGTFAVFENATTLVQGLSIIGGKAYWIEGANVYSANLSNTGERTLVQSFTLGPVSLGDLAIDPATQTYLLSAATSGIPPLIVRYPLVQNASGNLFGFTSNLASGLTVAGGRVYWIDGSSVWSENLDGTGLTLQETLPAGLTPTDLAVSIDTPAAVPEPASSLLLGGGLLLAGLVLRRR